MNFGSKFNRVKQQADRLFLRGDKTDVVGDLRFAEEQAEELRLLCEAFSRSVEKSLNTHMVTEEKKHRKVPENQVAETLREALKELSQNQTEEFSEKPLFRTTIEGIVGVEQFLGKEVLDHEELVEAEILIPLQKLLKEDFPSIAKQKKSLKQAGQDVDAAKAKVRSSHASVSQPNKLETYKEELEEAEGKLEQIKDSYACDLFSVLGKQRDVTRLSNLYLDRMADHLQKSLKGLNDILPPIRKIYEESSCSPVYGVPLYEHLRITQQEISVPIQVCVKRMIEFGLLEEGLLRMAGSTTKIKRLKGLFDAGLVSVDTTLEDYNRDYDVHVIAGAFKSYLRELPEPLLTHTKHDELIEAVRKQDHKEKLRHMWQVINALPAQNYTNLRYVIKFLSMLASHSGENKMTPNNIAIVMAPNLIGTQRETDNEIMALGRNMTLGNDYRVVVEQLIEYCDYFFKGELDFGVVPQRSEPPPSPKQTAANGTTQFTRTGSHRRTGSSDLSISVHPESESPKQPHRMKKKPAPLPPQGKGGWFDEAGQAYHPANHSPEPTRSKTPPASAILNSSTVPTPSPAPRLHHTNSIKRPTAEPPKPPSGTAPPVKPPRPSPPTLVSDTEPKDPKPPRPCPPHAKEAKPEGVEGPAIGFENPDASNPTTTLELGLGAPNAPVDEGSLRQAPVIGFNVEGTRVRDKVRETEQLQEWTMRGGGDPELKRGNGGGTDPEFRKSLEGVLKHQPQVHSRHLLRHSFVAEPSSGDPLQESKAPVQLPVFPVPAQRSSKEAASGDRPEPAPRSDKPAVPEKPPAINRCAGASDHPRPVIHDKPVVALGSKPGSLSSLSNQGMSRSNEKLVETDVQGCDKGSSSSKSEDALENDVNVVEKPSKPPKPSNVWAPIEGENATKAVNSDGGEDPKDSKRDPESKPVSGNLGSKPDSTNL